MENKTKIKSIKIQNFKGLKSWEGDVHGQDIWLIGKNAAGKTSFIEAVFVALTGKNIPPKPITTGANKGLIEVTLDDGYVVRTNLSAKGKTPVTFEIENLNAIDEKDQFVKAPRTWLNNRIGVIDFDVNDFFAMSDAKQVEYFCKITGIDVSEMDEQIEELMESRKFDKKEVARLQGLTGFYKNEDAEKELIDVVALSKEIIELKASDEEKNNLWKQVTDGVAEFERQKIELEAKLNGGTYLTKEGVTINVEVGINENIANGIAFLEDSENKPVENSVLKAKETEFENSAAINLAITEAKSFKDNDEKIEKLQAQIEEATEDIDKNKDLKSKVISEKINIEGLTYSTDLGCFLFNDLPFDKNQTNTASQIIAGLKIGASLLKEVKLLKVDASLIDKENFDKVQKWTKEQGIELFIELVDREAGALKIEIEEEVIE